MWQNEYENFHWIVPYKTHLTISDGPFSQQTLWPVRVWKAQVLLHYINNGLWQCDIQTDVAEWNWSIITFLIYTLCFAAPWHVKMTFYFVKGVCNYSILTYVKKQKKQNNLQSTFKADSVISLNNWRLQRKARHICICSFWRTMELRVSKK